MLGHLRPDPLELINILYYFKEGGTRRLSRQRIAFPINANTDTELDENSDECRTNQFPCSLKIPFALILAHFLSLCSNYLKGIGSKSALKIRRFRVDEIEISETQELESSL